MSISIRITGEAVAAAHLYSEKNRQGKRSLVPAYRMAVENAGERHEFAVTRDTALGPTGEPPLHDPDSPYSGHIREDGALGFRIQLYEKEFGCTTRIKGLGPVTRTHIQIHRGPGKSEGCFLLAGGKREHARFERTLKKLLANASSRDIAVYVERR